MTLSALDRSGALARRPPAGVRILDRGDLPAAMRVLALSPVENVFVSSRIHSAGLEAGSLGCPVWGYERDGVLRSLCHAGANLVPVNADADAIEAWAEFAGPERMCFSIVGPSARGHGTLAAPVGPLGNPVVDGSRRTAPPAGDGGRS